MVLRVQMTNLLLLGNPGRGSVLVRVARAGSGVWMSGEGMELMMMMMMMARAEMAQRSGGGVVQEPRTTGMRQVLMVSGMVARLSTAGVLRGTLGAEVTRSLRVGKAGQMPGAWMVEVLRFERVRFPESGRVQVLRFETVQLPVSWMRIAGTV